MSLEVFGDEGNVGESSPQARVQCACPEWTTASGCAAIRYPGTTGDDEPCDCECHELHDDDDEC